MHSRLPSLIACRFFVSSLLAIAPLTSHAANVTWEAPHAITGDIDVSTAGTLIEALNIGVVGVLATTVNGVTFASAPAALGSNTMTTAALPFGNLSPAYQVLLASAFVGNGALTYSPGGLIVGATYQIQWWCNRTTGTGFITTGTAGTSSIALNSNVPGTTGGLGQFATGTFIADATSQTFSFDQGGGVTIVNAIQLRQIVIPEPGSALLLAMGGVGALLLRRSRHSS